MRSVVKIKSSKVEILPGARWWNSRWSPGRINQKKSKKKDLDQFTCWFPHCRNLMEQTQTQKKEEEKGGSRRNQGLQKKKFQTKTRFRVESLFHVKHSGLRKDAELQKCLVRARYIKWSMCSSWNQASLFYRSTSSSICSTRKIKMYKVNRTFEIKNLHR